ncbi:MAG: TIGR04282 family arsenosugar biosynthesis glycosyltransferase [Sandaracinaceae bacterium]
MRVEVAVFARAPRPGATKTRLIPALGAAGAAALYGAFLEDTLAKLEGLDARIWAASADDVEALSAHGLPVSLQPDADLGARMEAAMRVARGTHDAGLVIGTDAPTLPATRLREAIDALTRHDVVIGPSADGGYYLIGAREPLRFAEVRWSTPHALADTLASIGERRVRLLRPHYDVDTPEDLALLRTHLRLKPRAAPATARHFDRVGGDG